MARNIFLKSLPGSIILLIAVLSQLSCKKNGIELSDLVGTWKFQNTIVREELKELFDGRMTFILNADRTISVASMDYLNLHGFGFSAEIFRMVVHHGLPLTHILSHILWEGEKTGYGLLSGKIYFSRPAADNDIMHYDKEAEVGSFTARRLAN